MVMFHLVEMAPSEDGKSVKITITLPRAAIGAETDRSLRSWFASRARDPAKMLKLAGQVLHDEEVYRNLPQWDLNQVCEGCGRPLVPTETITEEEL